MRDLFRKIPFNYTSAGDDQIIAHLFGNEILETIRVLETLKGTGRSSRLLHRFMGDLFVIRRNAFLFQELVEHPVLRRRLFTEFENDLFNIAEHAEHEEVRIVLDACRSSLRQLKTQINAVAKEQTRVSRRLSPVVGKNNICFDPFNITAHITDATDWRRYTPAAVIRPDREDQIPKLVKKLKDLKFHIIPRGGGTGLTGGATPLAPDCVMINTEKLNTIFPIEHRKTPDGRDYAVMPMEAGVITQDAKDSAAAQGYIFATDPTSAWACTIGGNLAENAGGKTAVLYGTAIDNVLSFRITMPDGQLLTVARQDHPLRKILYEDTLSFVIKDETGKILDTIELNGADVRKKGLGKDVTNKVLGGLPGVQKEGCDGIITWAEFILYPEFAHKATCCIEFFGNDMTEAGKVITQICTRFENSDPALMALEHFDEEYIKAIKYKTKRSVGDRLKAVLLIDMVSNDLFLLDQGMRTIETILEAYDKTGLSIARNRTEAARYWEDRKRLGAIAAHTNAFKLNEDIVLPIDSLADFVRFVDDTNLEEKKYTQGRIIQNILTYLETAIPQSDPEWLGKKVGRIKDLAYGIRKKLDIASRDALEAFIHTKNFHTKIQDHLHGYSLVLSNVEEIYNDTLSRLIVIATHMHAGDGNVHVNIPVFSNDKEMLARAHMTADKVMAKAVALDGVVSGEHGIGVTKFKYLDKEQVSRFDAYRKQVDPNGLMNPGKLSESDILNKVFTPSFNLMKLEAQILKHGSLSELSASISHCVRCGKCKPECPVFYPARNMFFHPRNKNLALGALIEALLYITQRTQSTKFKVLKNLEQIGDHCTICHKCLEKCPVNIDTGVISIKEREILKKMNFKHTPVPTKLTLGYLGNRNQTLNPIIRTGLLTAGSAVQQTAVKLAKSVSFLPALKETKALQMLNTSVSQPGLTTLRAHLPSADRNQAILIDPPGKITSTVFYFPGCGSERMFSNISKATIFLLLSQGHQVVLPPPYMCCGYPLKVNARIKEAQKVSLENTIIMTQIRDMFYDLDFSGCIVSCGTCMDSLSDLGITELFDAKLFDISGYLFEHGLTTEEPHACLYHAPCHDSLKGTATAQLAKAGIDARPVPYCCSEAGTMSLSRPDISYNMFLRKQETVKQVSQGLDKVKPKILTNCPSCVQGLGRQSQVTAVHMAVALARLTGGADWMKQFRALIKNMEIVTF
ncbi:DUF3683 domain-containing protein [uncultured Desulfobacter sp.]|uniref:DUF3683 domain-containing protein n=1 Tax=uncultured Desulfobacter sp. TaxID=240139 RepID=UPI0029F4697A|nr:DUF3683 domain-containing protein [uncultured Desulfobacter sp.]